MSTRLPFDFSDHHTPWAHDTSFLQNIETDLPPEDLYGRWIVWGQQQKMDPKPKEPPMLESSSKDDYDFAALQANQDLTEWKSSFVVEDSGTTGNKRVPGRTHGRELQILKVACSQGLAAGKLWIDGEQAETAEKLPFSCSGFCLEDKFFISTQHFLRRPTDDPLASTQDEHLAQLMDPKLANVEINTARESSSMEGNSAQSKAAYLIYHDPVLDIAIFRLKDSEEGWTHTVRMNQLEVTEQHLGKSIFTVGYAGSCDDPTTMKLYREYWDNTVNAPQSLKDAVTQQKIESLKQQGLPPPDRIFNPCQRAIAFGHVKGHLVREILDNFPRSYPKFYHHSIPGWFGMSGSMIGVIDESLQVKIIGLFKGGEPKDNSNRLVPLSAETIREIRESILRASNKSE